MLNPIFYGSDNPIFYGSGPVLFIYLIISSLLEGINLYSSITLIYTFFLKNPINFFSNSKKYITLHIFIHYTG